MTSARFLLYGATGFTGTLIAELARERRLTPILAGRDPGRLEQLAARLGFEHRVLHVEEPESVAAALRDVTVMLNAAGPFSRTAAPLVDACLAASTHYLDIAGELAVLDRISGYDARARSRGMMLMPGAGFVVVPSDCLAAYVTRRMPGARTLAIGISRTDLLSRGSLKTILEQPSDTVVVRQAGALRILPAGQLERRFDFGRGLRPSMAVSWGDVVTAYHTTGVPNIAVYLEVSPSERAMFRLGPMLGGILETAPLREMRRLQANLAAQGPSAYRRATSGRVIVAEARDAEGACARARLQTSEAYGFTAATALAVVERVLAGDVMPGFQTPARVYGPDFVLAAGGVTREDLPA